MVTTFVTLENEHYFDLVQNNITVDCFFEQTISKGYGFFNGFLFVLKTE